MSMRKKGPTPRDTPIFLRLTASERHRAKVAAAECDQTYGEFMMAAVERHEKRKQRAGAVAHSPLHDVGDFDIDE